MDKKQFCNLGYIEVSLSAEAFNTFSRADRGAWFNSIFQKVLSSIPNPQYFVDLQSGWSYGDTFSFARLEYFGRGGIEVLVSVKSKEGVSKGEKTLFMLTSDYLMSSWTSNVNCFCIIWQPLWDVRYWEMYGLSVSGVVKNASLPSIPDPVIPGQVSPWGDGYSDEQKKQLNKLFQRLKLMNDKAGWGYSDEQLRDMAIEHYSSMQAMTDSAESQRIQAMIDEAMYNQQQTQTAEQKMKADDDKADNSDSILKSAYNKYLSAKQQFINHGFPVTAFSCSSYSSFKSAVQSSINSSQNFSFSVDLSTSASGGNVYNNKHYDSLRGGFGIVIKDVNKDKVADKVNITPVSIYGLQNDNTTADLVESGSLDNPSIPQSDIGQVEQSNTSDNVYKGLSVVADVLSTKLGLIGSVATGFLTSYDELNAKEQESMNNFYRDNLELSRELNETIKNKEIKLDNNNSKVVEAIDNLRVAHETHFEVFDKREDERVDRELTKQDRDIEAFKDLHGDDEELVYIDGLESTVTLRNGHYKRLKDAKMYEKNLEEHYDVSARNIADNHIKSTSGAGFSVVNPSSLTEHVPSQEYIDSSELGEYQMIVDRYGEYDRVVNDWIDKAIDVKTGE